MNRQSMANWMTYLVLFLLPWQTRWIISYPSWAPAGWEYGTMSLYAVECLILIAVLFRGRSFFSSVPRQFFKSIGLFYVAICISIFFSVDKSFSLSVLIHLISATLLFLLLIHPVISREKSIVAFLSGLIPAAVLGWIQVLSGMSPASTIFGLASQNALISGASVIETSTGRILRAYGSFPHPNIFGGYLALACFLSFILYKQTINRHIRIFSLICLTLFPSVLILTFSRSAWIALVVSIVLLVLSPFPPEADPAFPETRRGNGGSLSKIRLRLVPFKLPLLITLTTLTLTATLFSSAIFPRFHPTQTRLEQKSLEERAGGYREFWKVFRRHPITGTGPGTYTVALKQLYPNRPVWEDQPVHNTVLLFLAETGFLGIGLLFLVSPPFTRGGKGGSLSIARHGGVFVLFPLALLDHYLWSFWPGLALLVICISFFFQKKV